MSVVRFAALLFVIIAALCNNNRGEGTPLHATDSTSSSAVPDSRSTTDHRSSDSTNNPPCEDFDGDECGCRMLDCDYNIGNGNQCVQRHRTGTCGNKDFWPGECRKRNGIYSIGGRMCRNTLQNGGCERKRDSQAHYAINLNGKEYTDSTQLHFLAHNSTPQSHTPSLRYQYAGDYGTSVCKKKGRGDAVDIERMEVDFSPDDIKNIMYGYIEGSEDQQQQEVAVNDSSNFRQCATFPVPLNEDGVFQLNLKCTEMEYYSSRTRRFDVRFNDVTIFPQVDLLQFAGKNCLSMDLMLNFVVRDGQQEIVLSGFNPMKLIGQRATQLQFCMSKCQKHVLHTNYIASAFSIIRLKGKSPFCR